MHTLLHSKLLHIEMYDVVMHKNVMIIELHEMYDHILIVFCLF